LSYPFDELALAIPVLKFGDLDEDVFVVMLVFRARQRLRKGVIAELLEEIDVGCAEHPGRSHRLDLDN
jgi:hypothetical protein